MQSLQEVLPKIKIILSQELNKEKILDKDIADALEIKQTTFATLKRRNKIPLEKLLDFCAKRKISINWLLYDQVPKSLEEETSKYINVKYFKNIYASAGGGAFNYEEEYENIILDESIFSLIAPKEDLKYIEAINVLGDSMEPELKDGDIIFINKNSTDISKGGIFAISTPNGFFVKRVRLKKDGSIDLISENQLYPIENISSGDIKIIGKVIGTIKPI